MIKVGAPRYVNQPIDLADCARTAQANHQLRQREGHHTPDWDALSDLMRSELIYREVMRVLALQGIALDEFSGQDYTKEQ